MSIDKIACTVHIINTFRLFSSVMVNEKQCNKGQHLHLYIKITCLSRGAHYYYLADNVPCKKTAWNANMSVDDKSFNWESIKLKEKTGIYMWDLQYLLQFI